MSRECLIGRKFAMPSKKFGNTFCGKKIPPILELNRRYACRIGFPCLNKIVYAPAIIPIPAIEIKVRKIPSDKIIKFSKIIKFAPNNPMLISM